VTGSARGIGAAIARLFARAGAAVVVHGRDETALSAVRSQIEDEGGRAIAVAADLTRVEDVEAMVEGSNATSARSMCSSPMPAAYRFVQDPSRTSAWRTGVPRWTQTSPRPS
jgi:NAD(P)-dependent dehydrogenase (short-subunit alcohol dehydrogenase family)